MTTQPANSRFEPKDTSYIEKVRNSFSQQQAVHTLGMTIEHLEPGVIVLEMPYAQAYTQQHGFIHAGIIATALDNACGYAALVLSEFRKLAHACWRGGRPTSHGNKTL